jgi:hypothetical protein
MTNFRYLNAALTRTGNTPVSTLPGTTAEGVVANENYENIVVAELTAYPWKWASTKRDLNLHTDTPHLPWLYAYEVPTDILDIRTVEVEGVSIDYELMGTKLLCMYGSDVTVTLKGWTRVDEEYWPADFGEAITRRLEALFLRSPCAQHEEAAARDEAADEAFEKARLADAKRKTPTDPRRYPILDARRGGPPSGRPLGWSRG